MRVAPCSAVRRLGRTPHGGSLFPPPFLPPPAGVHHINYPRRRVQQLADTKHGRRQSYYVVTFPHGLDDDPAFELVEVGQAGAAGPGCVQQVGAAGVLRASDTSVLTKAWSCCTPTLTPALPPPPCPQPTPLPEDTTTPEPGEPAAKRSRQASPAEEDGVL